MRFSICTLGCKTNQFESQAMAKLLTSRGHTSVPEGEEVDAYLINTCSVTAVSDRKSRQTIRHIRKEHPSALVAVCGCYSQLEPEELSKLQIDLLAGTGEKEEFILQLEQLYQKRQEIPSPLAEFFRPAPPQQIQTDNPFQRKSMEILPSGGLEGRTRALLKIQDGCDLFCSYCIIPFARGRIRSLPLEESRHELQALIDQGYPEIVLTGIEISAWGKDFKDGSTLLDFLQMADKVCSSADVYLRLGSLEPRTITPQFCAVAQDCPSLRPQFHLSLQSGSDTVLARMNRKYDTARFRQSVQWLRDTFPNAGITTDVIVGFPQESEEEFQETMDFIQDCAFSSMHIFPYSPRAGTPASKMEGQITKEVKEHRSKVARTLAQHLTQEYHQSFVGKTLPVLFELDKDGVSYGHSPQHIPVQTNSSLPLQNQTRNLRIESLTPKGLYGTVL